MTKILHCSLLLYNQIPVLKLYSSISVGVRALPGVRIDGVFTPILLVYILIGITSGCLALVFAICSTAKYPPAIFCRK